MQSFKTTISAAILGLVISFSAQGQTKEVKTPDPQKVAVIKELITLSGSTNIGNKMVTQLINSFKPAFPDVPNEVWERFAKKLNAEELVDSIIVVYDRHFSIEDLQAAVDFYRTPSGQRLLKELPLVMSEGAAIGQEWGKKKAAELIEELKAERAASKKSK